MMADDRFWEEASPEPPLSVRAWLAATLRKLRPTRSGALSFAKGISRLAEVRNFRELRKVFRKRKSRTCSFDADAGDDSDALPPSVVTHLKWKEGKLSDGGRWWGPFRSNRKQKYAEIQNIIGEIFLPTDATPPPPFFQCILWTPSQLFSPSSDAPCAGDGKLRKPVKPECDSDDDGFETAEQYGMQSNRSCLEVL